MTLPVMTAEEKRKALFFFIILNFVAFIVCLAGVICQMYQIVDHLDNESTYFETKETVYNSMEMPSMQPYALSQFEIHDNLVVII
jgi:hypothetical protein